MSLELATLKDKKEKRLVRSWYGKLRVQMRTLEEEGEEEEEEPLGRRRSKPQLRRLVDFSKHS